MSNPNKELGIAQQIFATIPSDISRVEMFHLQEMLNEKTKSIAIKDLEDSLLFGIELSVEVRHEGDDEGGTYEIKDATVTISDTDCKVDPDDIESVYVSDEDIDPYELESYLVPMGLEPDSIPAGEAPEGSVHYLHTAVRRLIYSKESNLPKEQKEAWLHLSEMLSAISFTAETLGQGDYEFRPTRASENRKHAPHFKELVRRLYAKAQELHHESENANP